MRNQTLPMALLEFLMRVGVRLRPAHKTRLAPEPDNARFFLPISLHQRNGRDFLCGGLFRSQISFGNSGLFSSQISFGNSGPFSCDVEGN